MAKRSASAQSPDALLLAQRLGLAVRHMRLRRRLTQAELAARAGIGANTLQRLERGDPGCALGNALEVLTVLDRGIAADLIEHVEADRPGRALEDARLPQRVHREPF